MTGGAELIPETGRWATGCMVAGGGTGLAGPGGVTAGPCGAAFWGPPWGGTGTGPEGVVGGPFPAGWFSKAPRVCDTFSGLTSRDGIVPLTPPTTTGVVP